MHRLVLLLLVALGISGTGCGSTATVVDDAPPIWARDETAGLDANRVLVGIASQRGSGPEASAAAKSKALGRLVEQIIADVSSEAELTTSERALLTLDDGNYEEVVATEDQRERLVRITANAQVLGARYDVATANTPDGTLTYARAALDRNDLAEVYATDARNSLDVARAGLRLGRLALSGGSLTGGLDGSAAGDAVVDGLVAATRGWSALDEPQAVLPFIVGLRPSSGAGRFLLNDYGSLRNQLGTALEEMRRRLVLDVENGPLDVSLAGHIEPVRVQVLWDGQPLAGLPLGLQVGTGTPEITRTAADGRAALRLGAPASRITPPHFVVVAADGSTWNAAEAPLSFPSPSDSRVAVVARHRLAHDRSATNAGREVSPSPLRVPIEGLMARLGFAVIPGTHVTPFMERRGLTTPLADGLTPDALAALQGRADFVLLIDTMCFFSSRTDVPASSQPQPFRLYWYHTTGGVKLVDVNTGEALTVPIATEVTKAAGRSAEHAAERSVQQTLDVLTAANGPDSLTAVLAHHFGGINASSP